MGEYLRSSHDPILNSNMATTAGNVDRTKANEDSWIECFRVVDTVLAKVIQVQRLHMNLFCEFVAFSDTDKRKCAVEKQRKECEHLEEEMSSLMKKMLDRTLGCRADGSKLESSTAECDPRVEIKQENDTELIDENNSNVEFSCAVRRRSNRNQLQSCSIMVDGALPAEDKKQDLELPRNFEFVSCNEWNNECNSIGMPEIPAIDVETSKKVDGPSIAEGLCDETEECMPDAYENSYERSDRKEIVYKPEIRNHSINTGSLLVVLPTLPAVMMSTRQAMPVNLLPTFDKNAHGNVEKEDYNVLERSVKTVRSAVSPTPISGDGRTYKCKVCAKKFTRKQYYTVHMRIHNSEKPYECEMCSKKFSQRSNLIAHLQVHNGEKPYECEICSKKFTRKANFIGHMRQHNGEKPYECEICSKKFSHSSGLKYHLQIHNGDKPYECEICSKKFAQSSSLRSHLQTHNDDKPFECVVCSRKFTRSSSLKYHLLMRSCGKTIGM